MWAGPRQWVANLGSADLVVHAAILAVVASAWVFVVLASAITEGTTQRFDERVVRMLRHPDDERDPLGPPWLEVMGRDITALGDVAILGLVTAAVAGYLWIVRAYHALWFVLTATVGGLLLSAILKALIDRERPDVVPHLSHVISSSFPSGHSLNSLVVYVTLGTLLARLVQRRRLKLYFLGIALLLTFLVGVSRVYMGVHYPTDVLAGWSAGLAWAFGCGLLARWLQRRGIVERSAD
jgi:undecaprenyl-diphosphatase